jgi:hypothetical protein
MVRQSLQYLVIKVGIRYAILLYTVGTIPYFADFSSPPWQCQRHVHAEFPLDVHVGQDE